MEKQYNPKKYEGNIYKIWEESEFFNPDKLPGRRSKSYSISIPPPNITGSLHMGHALNNTIQDIVIRYHRMRGKKTLWLPGTDHAGIATQNVVEKEIAKQGLTREQLGREKFVEKVWAWKEKYGNLILEQLKKLGCSCDWSRTRFTLDEAYTRAVQTAFIHYYKEGYIYRGPRIVNWCPRCRTAISDIEVKYQPEKGKLWYIKYPLVIASERSERSNLIEDRGIASSFRQVGTPRNDLFITVATTRPETMLGDTAVAVNPKDKRYKKLIGKKLILPIMNREIPLIAHRLVEAKFGTGAVKITPAHDATDWKIGKNQKLEVINVIGPDAKMTKEAGKYEGLPVLEARQKIVEELKILGLLEKEEDYEHQISLCDRCSTPIEPQISTQWFVKMSQLAKPAIGVIEKNKIKIIPERYKKICLDWLASIEDWCISRQLWWGHRLPVWQCQTGNLKSKIKNQSTEHIKRYVLRCSAEPINMGSGQKSKIFENSSAERFVVSAKKPKRCPFCGKCEMKQSADVLDTWFSSALWPFATLGWPEKSKDLKKFYPTSFLSTAPEILYLWVARMVFSSLEFIKKIPFREVYLHATILNIEGKRMSKSLETGVDPLELINTYGADATRFGLIYQTSRDQQAVKFDERAIKAARNFVNKLWNIFRFAQNQKFQPKADPPLAGNIKNKKYKLKIKKTLKPTTLADKWILSKLNSLIESITKKIENYELGEAARELYEFTWHELADWYLEISKFQMDKEKLKTNTVYCLQFIVYSLLKLLHPFIPFVTEQIWQSTNYKLNTNIQITNKSSKKQNLLIVADWPKVDKKFINKKTEKEFEKIKNFVVKIRNWKQEQGIPLKEEVEYKACPEFKEILKKVEKKNLIEKMARVKIAE